MGQVPHVEALTNTQKFFLVNVRRFLGLLSDSQKLPAGSLFFGGHLR